MVRPKAKPPVRRGPGGRASARPNGTRRRFPGISPLAWQHPDDLEAMAAVRRLPALDQVVKAASEHWFEKAFLVESVGSRIRLGPRQAPRIWNLFREAADILDMPSVPQVFLTTHGQANAYAFGMKEHTITLHSALVDLMTEEELMSVIGHELSHIKCEHMLYRSLAMMLARFSGQVLTGVLGVGRIAVMPLQLALLAWSRRAELTCDRGSLLVVQDPKIVASSLAKMAGMSRSMIEELDMDEVYRQAEEYEKTFDETLMTRGFKFLSSVQATHPAPVWRAKVISDWSEGEAYADIFEGHYLTVRQAAKGHRFDTEGASSRKPCAACGHRMEPIFVFCPACGATIDEALRPCHSCGNPVEPDWTTCPHCGA